MRGYLRFVLGHGRFLGFGFALTFFSSFGQTTFIGLFGAELRADFGLSHGAFGLLYAAATVMSGTALIWLGRPIDRVDLRLYSALVCLAMAGSAFSLSLAGSVLGLGLAIFAMRLSCQGLLVHTAVTAMARYFLEGRGKAVSLAAIGNNVGQGVFPGIAVALVALWGWRETWQAVAAAGLCVLPLSLWLLRGHGARHRRWAAQLAAPAPHRAASAEAPERSWTRGEVQRDPAFYLMLPALLAAPFITTGFFFHASALVAAKGWELGWYSGFYALYAASTVAAALLTGGFIDRAGAVRLLPWFLWPLAAGLLLLGVSGHWLAALGYLALMGVSVGAAATLNGAIWAEVYGVGHIGAIRALGAALMIFATAASPAIFGAALDAGVAIESVALACIAGIGASSLAATRLRPGRPARADSAAAAG